MGAKKELNMEKMILACLLIFSASSSFAVFNTQNNEHIGGGMQLIDDDGLPEDRYRYYLNHYSIRYQPAYDTLIFYHPHE